MRLPRDATLQKLCLIVLNDILIGHDLTGIIEDARPDLRVVLANSDAEAMQHLTSSTIIAVAFVSAPPHSFAPTALAARIAQDAGCVIYLGYEPDYHGTKDVPVMALRYPFAADDVLDLLPKT